MRTQALQSITAHIVAYRFQLENERMANMDRLSEKVSRASGVVGRLTKKFEVKLDELIARENPVDQRMERTFAAAHGAVDDHLRGLDSLEGQLALISNDPLGGSSSGSEAGQVVGHDDVGQIVWGPPKAQQTASDPPGHNKSV